MNQSELERKLLAAGRANAPSDAVPYAFEQRVMARLRSMPVRDAWAEWSGALWKAVAPCAAIAITLMVWSSFNSQADVAVADLTADFEQTVLAAITQDLEGNW
jgi:hypothetical protein